MYKKHVFAARCIRKLIISIAVLISLPRNAANIQKVLTGESAHGDSIFKTNDSSELKQMSFWKAGTNLIWARNLYFFLTITGYFGCLGTPGIF